MQKKKLVNSVLREAFQLTAGAVGAITGSYAEGFQAGGYIYDRAKSSLRRGLKAR